MLSESDSDALDCDYMTFQTQQNVRHGQFVGHADAASVFSNDYAT